jgi:serine/threonine-protein kinase RsbW
MKLEEINIKLPAKPEYMSVARLTTAAIANRMGFTIDDIEDLKVAVSEACSFLIRQFSDITNLTIDYQIDTNADIHVTIASSDADVVNREESRESELSLFSMESVADKVTKVVDNGVIRGFSILKTGGNSLEHE